VNIAAHLGLGQVAEQRIRKGVSHGVDVDVGRKPAECLQTHDHRSNALAQQSEMRIVLGLDPVALLQEDELHIVTIDGNVEDILGLLQYGIGRSVYVACVDYHPGVLVLFLLITISNIKD